MSQGGGQQGDDKNAMQILWIIFGVFFIAAAIWWGFSKELKQFFIFVKLWELKIINYFFEFFNLTSLQREIYPSINLANRLNHVNITPDAALDITNASGKYVRFIVGIFIFVGCYFFYVKNVKVRYKKRYSTKTLMLQEKILWPQIEVVSKLDLAGEDIDSGPWAMGETPMQFAKKHKILDISVDTSFGFGQNAKFIMKVDKNKAAKVFAAQLGRVWNGPDRMAPHRKALFAVFLARGCRDTNAARDLVERMNRTIGAGKQADYTGVDDIIKKHYKTRDVQEICNSHAYESTIIISLLLFARQDGVLPTAEFLWLKPLDRKFWYILNSVGRQTPYPEAGGVHAHWLAEKSLGKPLTVPFVDEAVKAIEIAMSELIYEPSPEERDELLKKAQEAK